jgi:hypothetical protein
MGPGSRSGPRPQVGNSLACAEFDRRAALAAVDSRGVELGDNRVVATVFRSESRAGRIRGLGAQASPRWADSPPGESGNRRRDGPVAAKVALRGHGH